MATCEIASIIDLISSDSGKIRPCRPGNTAPNSDGPSATPASNWPKIAG